MSEVKGVILERVKHDRKEYSAVPEINGCTHCAFEEERVRDCQSAIGQAIHIKEDSVYCMPSKNPYDIGLIWIETKKVPQYIAKAVIHRMEKSTEE